MFSIIILAIIQGIAEFLPISSSAHLIIFRDVFMIGKDVIATDLELTFDIALHFGTALAIIVFFFKDFWNMFVKGITKGVKDKDGKIMWYIIAASIPAAVVGLLFEDVIDGVIRNKYWLIALALIIIGAINWGLIGILKFNLVAAIFGDMTALARIVYSLVGLSGLWGIKLLFDEK
jgi:undecaprenyl-diphosphatase